MGRLFSDAKMLKAPVNHQHLTSLSYLLPSKLVWLHKGVGHAGMQNLNSVPDIQTYVKKISTQTVVGKMASLTPKQM